ncbi:caspase domain-containing protein [Flavobacterium aquaticum]|uniref:Caspase domain-containing protein n=1 Tax=Flavobacterium aquaticum TaxID=1236486 RepID=A0A327YUY6_9FLAO|nr:caspase family protein [Flavobacterium aquaticum]RAK24850.1 caspase domain-containing protein [Flavobacterium aquaticum]
MKINKIIGIAINDYDNPVLDKIENCKQDVNTIIGLLSNKYTFDDVELITDKKNTTRKALYNKLNEYFINTLEDESILLIYAGHGVYNEKLQTSYWQTSDSDPEDSSSWFNINDLLDFIRASKAFHISIISDSCFSGAIFKDKIRGGGIDAFNTKKSRYALTSGGMENVSDGKKGHLSPFAETLVKLLEENTSEELPFSILANNLLMNFTESRSQTPMCGALNDVGHDGGSFILKLKEESNKEVIDNKNTFLKNKLNNLFIELSPEDVKIIDTLKPIREEKLALVKKQKYEEAAALRYKEKELEEYVYNKIPKYIDDLININEFTPEEIQKAEKLDSEIENYEKERAEKKIQAKEKYEKLKADFTDKEGKLSFQKSQNLRKLAAIHYVQNKDRPEHIIFRDAKDTFIKLYTENIIELVSYFVKMKSTSKSEFLKIKELQLKELLIRVYKYEIDLVGNGHQNDLDNIITLKEIEIEFLNWIKNNYKNGL